MGRVIRGAQRGGRSVLARLDAWLNALYGTRYNPLYHSGALVVGCFVILAVTGLYLLLFYRIGAPYESVERITGQVWAGRWIRGLHRYVSDLAIVAAVVHAFRMAVQNRTWGPRALAWVSGLVLLSVLLVCGWTGYVMVWDVQAQLVATEGARLLDVLPIFAEPIARTFVGERPMPSAFFFLNLFAHIAIPVGILLILWIHVSRLARPALMPTRPLFWATTGLFTVLSVAWPISMAPRADLLRVPSDVALDVFYGFWIPLSQAIPPGAVWLTGLAAVAAVLAVPFRTRPPDEARVEPSWVNPRFCTGCEQCYHDCPYEAISMVRRGDGQGDGSELKGDRSEFVALVDPSRCVSCGICAGSCAPMGVGPPGRTGRDQLAAVKEFVERASPKPDDIVLVGCAHSAARSGEALTGAPLLRVSCAGNLHTSVVEYLVRAGAGGVMVVSCPPRDCWNREGVKWLAERLYNERAAELKDRVDRRRLRVTHASEGQAGSLVREVERFRAEVRSLERTLGESSIELNPECDLPAISVAQEGGS